MGVCAFLLGLVLCFTIIGILFGLPMMWGGIGMLMATRGRQPAICPHCRHKRNYVHNAALNFTCAKCRQLTTIDWRD
jgi:hypothetical protein